jgi:hypothetical protein
MDLGKLKVSVGILFVVLAQAAGLVWYIAQMDSSINQLQKDIGKVEVSLEITRDLSKIAIFEQQLNIMNERLMSTTVVLEEKIYADGAVVDSFSARLNELDATITSYTFVNQDKLDSLPIITEEDPLVTQEDLKKYAKKNVTNQKLQILEEWMEEVKAAEEKAKQSKKNKKNTKKDN